MTVHWPVLIEDCEVTAGSAADVVEVVLSCSILFESVLSLVVPC